MNTSDYDKSKGLYRKFHVKRTDGRSALGEKHHDCEYFVLDLDHDPLAVPALKAYAEAAAEIGYHELAKDLRLKIHEIELRDGGQP